jgi:hypothetical protein
MSWHLCGTQLPLIPDETGVAEDKENPSLDRRRFFMIGSNCEIRHAAKLFR